MIGIASVAEPGESPDFDHIIGKLLTLQAHGIITEVDAEIAENILESLGRLALIRPSWREYLKRCDATRLFAQRIHTGQEHRRLLKYAFWAAAAVSGLHFVCDQLREHLRSPDTIDAAFCTIIDILDDDISGDWVLTTAERCADQGIPMILRLIAEAMSGYLAEALLQSRGCHCIGLLIPLSPQGAIEAEVVLAVFNAVRRHVNVPSVVRDAFFACHALLEPGVCSGAVSTLREHHAEAIARQALTDHGSNPHNAELLEEAVILLCGLSGIQATVQVLKEAGPGLVRTVGIKALVEFGRRRQNLLQQHAEDIIPAITSMAAESPEDNALHQNITLLVGFCNAVSAPG